MKLWTINVEMGVSESVGSDVPNLMKNVPNFVKDVLNFVNDVQGSTNAFRSGDRPQITLFWVLKRNSG